MVIKKASRRHILMIVLIVLLSALAVSLLMRDKARSPNMTARSLLYELKVAPAEQAATYDRKLFPHWRNAGRRCLSANEEVYIRDSLVVIQPTCDKIRVGRWFSLYDGATTVDASFLEVDHVVALKEAWVSGAWRWSTARRQAFANDLGYNGSLLAVTKSAHSPKKDKDPSEWLPNHGTCEFVQHWVAVKWRWRLSIDLAEKNAIGAVLEGTCGDEKVSVARAGD